MISVALAWQPGPGVLSQILKYKLASAADVESNWTSITLSNTANSYTVNNLSDNVIYDFKVLSVCQNNDTSSSPVVKQINMTCATVNVTPSSNNINYSITPVGGDVNSYSVQLLSSADAVLETQTKTGSPITGSFSGNDTYTVEPSTSYKIKVTQTAGTFVKSNCAVSSFSTTSATCTAPASLSATVVTS